jgi:hypothetical protein
MERKDKYLEQLGAEIFRNTQLEEPSESFTANVMQSVTSFIPARERNNPWNNLWYLLLLPLLIPVYWFLFVRLEINTGITSFINPVLSSLSSWFATLKQTILIMTGFHFTPHILACLVAVLVLLLIDRQISIRKQHSAA